MEEKSDKRKLRGPAFGIPERDVQPPMYMCTKTEIYLQFL